MAGHTGNSDNLEKKFEEGFAKILNQVSEVAGRVASDMKSGKMNDKWTDLQYWKSEIEKTVYRHVSLYSKFGAKLLQMTHENIEVKWIPFQGVENDHLIYSGMLNLTAGYAIRMLLEQNAPPGNLVIHVIKQELHWLDGLEGGNLKIPDEGPVLRGHWSETENEEWVRALLQNHSQRVSCKVQVFCHETKVADIYLELNTELLPLLEKKI